VPDEDVGALLATGVARAWYTDGAPVVPVDLFGVAMFLLVAEERELPRWGGCDDDDGRQR
jgi:hypothetical protein